jgi:hypothetical protein
MDNMGTAVRMGDTMLGLATVESTRPACAGSTAATLLNMMIVSVCCVRDCGVTIKVMKSA